MEVVQTYLVDLHGGNAGSNHPSPGQGSGSGGGSSAGDPEGGAGGPAALGAYPGGGIPIAPSNKGGGGAGGGGAGGAGTPGSTSPGPGAPWTGGGGGVGLQAPTTFRNPDSTTGTPGPNPGGFYFAGGGAGGLYEPVLIQIESDQDLQLEAVDLVDNHHPQVREVMVSLLPEVAVVVQVPLTHHQLSMVEMVDLVSFSSRILPN